MEVKDLELSGIIAFDGITKNALRLHPNMQHLIYPMGTNVAVKDLDSGEQKFLTGHTNSISAICISPCGKYVASGQVNHLGFKAMVIIWDFHERKMKGHHEIHKVRVDDMCFTSDSNYLISLGGRDDGNVVVWSICNNEPICGSYASNDTAGNACTITRTNVCSSCFVTGGDNTLKLWRIDPETRKLRNVDVKVGKLRRTVSCVVVDQDDENLYCGTTSGDIIKARLNFSKDKNELRQPIMVGCYSKIPQAIKKMKMGEGDLYAGGISNILLLKCGKMIVGTGDGTVELVEISNMILKVKSKFPSIPRIVTHIDCKVCAPVTSIVQYKENYILVGTAQCEIYQIKISNFNMRLLVTCHISSIYGIAFPCDYSEIFATGGKNDVRLWRLETQKELLRITVPNFVCSSLIFSCDGRMILSGWNDGMIRAFKPQSGNLIFTIYNAHIKAVSAIAITKDGTTLISGGCDGQVRMWSVRPDVQKLLDIFKEHRSPITSLDISSNDEDLISSSTDGTCIVWDLTRRLRKQVLMGNTMYMSACFSRNGIQILTCGTDRKIAYWETWDGSLIREIEGSEAGALNCIHTSPDGRAFVTGSNDCVVKLYDYETANVTHIGVGHAAIITACKFSPNGKYIVTVSSDGAIMTWKYPFAQETQEAGVGTARSKSGEAAEEEQQKLELNGLDTKEENVADLSKRPDTADTVRTIHSSDGQQKTCTCQLTARTNDKCCCMEGKTAREKTELENKPDSAKSAKSASNELNKKE